MHWQTTGGDSAFTRRSWADQLAQAYVRLEPRLQECPVFRGSIEKVAVDRIALSRVRASAHSVSRLAEHIRQGGADLCFVNLQIEGVGLTRRGGQEILSRPLDVTVVDTTEPFDIQHRSDFSLYSLIVPREILPPDLVRRGGVPLSRSVTGREIARTLMGYAELALRAQNEAPVPLPLVGRHVADLLACLDAWGGDSAPQEKRAHARLMAMCDYIERNLEDEQLGAVKLARVFGVSPRCVHKLFAETETTVSEYVCKLRIRHSLDLLHCADSAGMTVTRIAFQLGFRDLSYFNRRFKQLTGETPTQYRRRLRGA